MKNIIKNNVIQLFNNLSDNGLCKNIFHPFSDEITKSPTHTIFRSIGHIDKKINCTRMFDFLFDLDGCCEIDMSKIFDSSKYLISSVRFLFNDDCKIEDISLINQDGLIDCANYASIKIFDYLKNEKSMYAHYVNPHFFINDGFLIKPENIRIYVKVDPMWIDIKKLKMKMIINYSICLNKTYPGAQLKMVQSYGKNYTTYYIPENKLNNNHNIDFNFGGNIRTIMILLEPFNNSSKFEFTGKLMDGDFVVALFNDSINRLNAHKLYKISNGTYDSNVIISSSCVDLYRNMNIYFIKKKLNLSFALKQLTNDVSGSVLVHIFISECAILNDAGNLLRLNRKQYDDI